MSSVFELLTSLRRWRKTVLMAGPLPILLVVLVPVLFAMAFFTSFRSPVAALQITRLTDYLNGLLEKCKDPFTLHAEGERAQLEILLNKVKTSHTPEQILGNDSLKKLLGSVCADLERLTRTRQGADRTAWIQLNETALDFNQLYFHP